MQVFRYVFLMENERISINNSWWQFADIKHIRGVEMVEISL